MQTPKLVLTADTTRGSIPFAVKFTGTFLGRIDTVKMDTLKCYLLTGVPGEFFETFPHPDTILRRTYELSTNYGYDVGTYKAVMVVQTKYQEFVSDTLVITVEYPPGYYHK
jgi:hypothetical protein